ncbi:MAG: class I SAM-dependent methyltransferase [Alphaproteobacteria bacterium]|nr:class I SAM-dependent methyltransferase [Alphaproteobacteria bacterium]
MTGMGNVREQAAFQDFVGASRRFWSERMLPVLTAEADAARRGPAPIDEATLAARLSERPTYDFFCWLERHLQRMKYSGPRGIVAALDARRDEFEAMLARPLPDGALRLDPDLALPGYYVDCDIHQQPGGLWSDPLGGAIYREAAGGSAGVVARSGLHDRFTSVVAAEMPEGWARLVDLGCGYGKSALPFARSRPEAVTVGVDLAAPALRLAAQLAADMQARNLRYLQADARATGLPAGEADVVTSTMVLHELPPDVIEAMLREAHRLLRPGGLSIHLDFLPANDAFARLLHFGHGRRNNEPFMEPLARMDLAAAHRAAGFEAFRVTAFEDEDGALDRPPDRKWRLPWAVVLARKPS